MNSPEAWERHLGETLHHAADTISPPDRLSQIRAAVHPGTPAVRVRRSLRWRSTALVAGAVAATIVAAALGGRHLVSGPNHPPLPVASHSTEAFGDIALPVYYAARTDVGPQLAREFHHGPDTGRLQAALQQLMADPQDGDYDTWVPQDMVASAQSTDGRITVELTDQRWTERPTSMSLPEARVAGLQIVYTVRAVEERGKLPVAFTVDGAPVSTVLGVSVTDLTGTADREALVPINLTLPETGDSVDARVVVRGRGLDLERGWAWTITDAAHREVLADTVAVPDAPSGFSEFDTDVDVSRLAPGDYEIAVRITTQSTGEGLEHYADTKQFQIR